MQPFTDLLFYLHIALRAKALKAAADI